MRFKRLDLNLVVVLDALLAERSVTKAGQRLHASQTTISDALGRLRQYFNDDLLTQVGRKMVPTPLGESLAGPARGMLMQAEALLNTTPSFEPGAAVRTFTLMMSDYVSTVLISRVASDLSRVAPGVRLEIRSHSVHPRESLERGEIDFLIMPPRYLSPDHPDEPLFEDDHCCIVWSGNNMPRETVSLEQFLRMGHVVARFGPTGSSNVDDWLLKHHGDVRRIDMVAMGFHGIPQALVGTDRIATVQRTLADYYKRLLPIRILEPEFELPTLLEHVQWNRFASTDPGLVWMRQVLREHSARCIQDASAGFPLSADS